MLKIKENVDLKELEKYGFTEIKGQYFKKTVMICKNKRIQGTGGTKNWSKMYAAEELYDLIKADLVEKVGD